MPSAVRVPVNRESRALAFAFCHCESCVYAPLASPFTAKISSIFVSGALARVCTSFV